MKPRHAAAIASVVRYRLLRGEIDAEIIILMVVSVFVLFRRRGMGFQLVANRTRTALSLCHAAALVLVGYLFRLNSHGES